MRHTNRNKDPVTVDSSITTWGMGGGERVRVPSFPNHGTRDFSKNVVNLMRSGK